VRLAHRKAVEVLGLRLTEEGRLALLASMGVSEPPPTIAPTMSPVEQLENEAAPDVLAHARDAAEPAPAANPLLGEVGGTPDSQPQTSSGALATAAGTTGEPAAS